jgi:hypothetical protein
VAWGKIIGIELTDMDGTSLGAITFASEDD